MWAVKLRKAARESVLVASRSELRKSSLSTLAVLAVAGFVAVPLAGPASTSASAWFVPGVADSRNLVVSGSELGLNREDFAITGGWGMAPAAGRPDPGTAQAYALEQLVERGWDYTQYSCLVVLWHKESGWNHRAQNPRSGAYGIPQSLPAERMASAGSDWATNPETQIRWGLGYIEGRYGTPCAAWGFFQQRNWY